MSNIFYTSLQLRVVVLFMLIFPAISFAQEYKALQFSEIIIIDGGSLHPYNKMIIKKDSSLLPTGYYTTPDKYGQDILYFYIAPNGKMNKTLKVERPSWHAYSLTDMVDDSAEGKSLSYVDSILRSDRVMKNGVAIHQKNYKGKRLESESAHNELGGVLWTKEFDNGHMSYMMEECEQGRNYRQSLYPNGIIEKEMYVDGGNGRSTEKKYSETGVLLYVEEVYGNTMNIKKKYFNNGKLSSCLIMKGKSGTSTKYDQSGKLTETTEIIPAENIEPVKSVEN